jgi:hypothetical protein
MASPSISVARPGQSTTIVIQSRPPGTEESYEIPGSKDPLFVDYGNGGIVTITYRGISHDAHFSNERNEMHLMVPTELLGAQTATR